MSSRWTKWAFIVAPYALCACEATDTGNPGAGGPPTDGPEGIEVVSSALSREASPDVSEAQLTAFGEGATEFAFDLYAQGAQEDGNVFMSPYSVQVGLSMLHAGAVGNTRDELGNGLRFALQEPELYRAFNATDIALEGRSDELAGGEESSGDLELRVVNAMFGQRGTAFQPDYLDTLAVNYGAPMYGADFLGDPEGERQAINQWVEDQTETRIKDLLPQGSLNEAVFVLANAIYFKGSWLTPFNPANTGQELFQAPGGDVTVSMMNGSASDYMQGDGYAALELKYIADAVRILFILPDEGRFDEVEAAFDADMFQQTRQALSRYDVTLKLPKFSFESELALKDAMQALGVQQAFVDGSADLSGIAGAPGQIFVSAMLHKAFVAVDEQGTEAAAATAAIGSATSAPPPADFFLDRPFMFVIHDEPTGQVLFVGRLVDPS